MEKFFNIKASFFSFRFCALCPTCVVRRGLVFFCPSALFFFFFSCFRSSCMCVRVLVSYAPPGIFFFLSSCCPLFSMFFPVALFFFTFVVYIMSTSTRIMRPAWHFFPLSFCYPVFSIFFRAALFFFSGCSYHTSQRFFVWLSVCQHFFIRFLFFLFRPMLFSSLLRRHAGCWDPTRGTHMFLMVPFGGTLFRRNLRRSTRSAGRVHSVYIMAVVVSPRGEGRGGGERGHRKPFINGSTVSFWGRTAYNMEGFVP